MQLSVTGLCCLLCSFHLYLLLFKMKSVGSNGDKKESHYGNHSGNNGSIYSIVVNDNTALYSNIDANRLGKSSFFRPLFKEYEHVILKTMFQGCPNDPTQG